MHNRKFVIGFLIFDVVAILAIVLYVVIANPFKSSVAPSISTTATAAPTKTNNTTKKSNLSQVAEVSMESMQVMKTEPAMTALREESEKTEDGLYYTSYLGYIETDVDGDGETEYFSVSLDQPSSSFYFLARRGDKVVDYVIPSSEFAVKEEYGTNVCKGELRGFMVDLDPSDKYIEIGVMLMRDNWKEYDTIIGRFDGETIHASRVHGFLSGLPSSGQTGVQFATYDTIYGIHKLFRNYSITNDVDFLKAQGDYFADVNVEQNNYLHVIGFDIQCTNLNGDEVLLTSDSNFYWARTDNETYVDVFTNDGYVYRLPVRSEVVKYESGEQTVYYLGDKYAADVYSKA